MLTQRIEAQRSWWKLILTGVLAFAFGIAAILFPADIMLRRILDLIFGDAKPRSGSMSAVAALLALAALVGIDGLINLFGIGVVGKRASRIRGFVGIAVALAVVFWPGMTAYIAVKLIGLWAVLIGVIEAAFAGRSENQAKDRVVLIIGAVASIVIGASMMRWVFAGAVVVSAVIGVAAAARGVSLIISGMHEQTHSFRGKLKRVITQDAV